MKISTVERKVRALKSLMMRVSNLANVDGVVRFLNSVGWLAEFFKESEHFTRNFGKTRREFQKLVSRGYGYVARMNENTAFVSLF